VSERDQARERHLATTINAVVGTIRRDGSIQLSPNWYLWTGEAIMVSTTRSTAKVHNVRRDPRATVCIDDSETGRYVTIAGPAEVIDDDRVQDLTQALIAKYVAEAEVVPHWERINRNRDRVIIRVEAADVWWRRGH
jgi:PPOX class probable F420-dependent enzyme